MNTEISPLSPLLNPSPDVAYFLQEEVELAEERFLKRAALSTALGTQIWPGELFKVLTGDGLIGKAEFERSDDDALVMNLAALLRARPAFQDAMRPFRERAALASLEWMPAEVMDHPTTPTFPRAVAALLGADLIPEEVKLARRGSLFRAGLERVLSEARRAVWATNLHMPHAHAFLTGSFTLPLTPDLAAALPEGDPRRKVLSLSRERFRTSAQERKSLVAFLHEFPV